MTKKEKIKISNIVDRIDKKRDYLKEKYKKSPQYKSTGKYKLCDQIHLDILLERRNTLVSVLNFCYTHNINELEDLI